jgi:hypothetical protein
MRFLLTMAAFVTIALGTLKVFGRALELLQWLVGGG